MAVVLDGRGLTRDAMHAFARWTNLSETAFVVPAEDPVADYHVRVFSPACEMSFAGHLSLGTCHAWLEAGGKPRSGDLIIQEGMTEGLVPVRRLSSGTLAFRAPKVRYHGPMMSASVEKLALALGVPSSSFISNSNCDNGPPWVGLQMQSADEVLALDPQFGRKDGSGCHCGYARWMQRFVWNSIELTGWEIGVVGAYPPGHSSGCDFEVRCFFLGEGGLTEERATGSLNAALAGWLMPAGLAPGRYVVGVGTKLHRAGRVTVEMDGNDIWVGGDVVTCVQGTVSF